MSKDRQHSFSYEELIRCGHGKLFGPKRGLLPLPDLLMFDRITSITEDGGVHGKGEVVAELDVHPDLWFFKCHFEGDPVMPGCLGLDALWQLSGFFMSWAGHEGKGRALGVGEVKFRGQVLPNAKLVTYRVSTKRVMVSKLRLIITDGIVEVDGRQIYSAENLRVGFFDSTDDF